MDCAYHPGVAAVGYCSSCARPVCQWCLQSLEGRSVCPTCASAATIPQPPAPVAAPSVARRSNTGMVLGLGCGGLLLLIVLIGGGIMGYHYYHLASLTQQEQQAKHGANKLPNTTPKESASDKRAEPSSPAAKPAAAAHPEGTPLSPVEPLPILLPIRGGLL